jgi:hypothetical protein
VTTDDQAAWVAAMFADLDLPSCQFMNSATLGPLIQNGPLPESILDDKVRRTSRKLVSAKNYPLLKALI